MEEQFRLYDLDVAFSVKAVWSVFWRCSLCASVYTRVVVLDHLTHRPQGRQVLVQPIWTHIVERVGRARITIGPGEVDPDLQCSYNIHSWIATYKHSSIHDWNTSQLHQLVHCVLDTSIQKPADLNVFMFTVVDILWSWSGSLPSHSPGSCTEPPSANAARTRCQWKHQSCITHKWHLLCSVR